MLRGSPGLQQSGGLLQDHRFCQNTGRVVQLLLLELELVLVDLHQSSQYH